MRLANDLFREMVQHARLFGMAELGDLAIQCGHELTF